MPCLIAAVIMTPDTLDYVIAGLKKDSRWKPEDDSALEALNGAFIKQDKTAYDMLLDAGLRWKPRNLYVAIKYETLHGVKVIIKEMRNNGLLLPPFEEISDAISFARSFKDKRKLQLLTTEGICA